MLELRAYHTDLACQIRSTTPDLRLLRNHVKVQPVVSARILDHTLGSENHAELVISQLIKECFELLLCHRGCIFYAPALKYLVSVMVVSAAAAVTVVVMFVIVPVVMLVLVTVLMSFMLVIMMMPAALMLSVLMPVLIVMVMMVVMMCLGLAVLHLSQQLCL